jgi:hypothetical protein
MGTRTSWAPRSGTEATNHGSRGLAARGESPPAFDERRILATGVAPSSNTGGIFSRRALFARRLAHLGATPDFHHGLLVCRWRVAPTETCTGILDITVKHEQAVCVPVRIGKVELAPP